MISERTECRACHGFLEPIHDFGRVPVINFGDREEITAPLELTKCASCHLVQLRHTVPREKLFKHYYYKSGVNRTMREHLREIVEEVQKRVKLKGGEIVVDIGSNDGTLLGFYPDALERIGFEPSDVGNQSYPEGTFRIQDFFSYNSYLQNAPRGERSFRAKVITAIAMFYDLDDPNSFLQDIKRVLAPDGLFIVEVAYLPEMLRTNNIGNVVHEHLCYYSFSTLHSLLSQNGFEIGDVEFSDINGGVFRAYIYHKDNMQVNVHNLGTLVKQEEEQNLSTMEPYTDFIKRVFERAAKLHRFMENALAGGPAGKGRQTVKTVDIYGPCYDSETRAVTTDGFKKFTELKVGDEVFTINPQTRALEIQPIQEVFINRYKGKMVHFRGKRIDLLVTPNHRMVMERRGPRKTIAFERADEAAKRSYFKLPRGVWQGVQNDTTQISQFVDQGRFRGFVKRVPEQIPTVDFLYLLGLYIGDGCQDTHSQGNTVNFCIPENDKARKPLKAVLDRNNIPYSEFPKELHLTSKALCEIFAQCGRSAHTKHIPVWALVYSPAELRHLFKGLIDSDGYYREGGGARYVTVSERLVSDIIGLGFRLGFYATFQRTEETAYLKGRRIYSIAYRVRFSKSQPTIYNISLAGIQNLRMQDYRGATWCVSVKNENFLVERNGKTAFCGNSTRGLMLLQIAGLTAKHFRHAVDRNPEKVGKEYAGVPVVSEAAMRADPPDYLLILPYSFIGEFVVREMETLKAGCKMIIPLPDPWILGGERL